MFLSCTHFWDADIGIYNQSYLHGEMIELPWSISIDNAFIKASRFFNGFECDEPYWSSSYINTIPIEDDFDYPYPTITYQYVFLEPYGINSLFQNGYTRLYDCVPPIPLGSKGNLITEPVETF